MALYGKAPMRGVHTFTVGNVSEALFVVKQALEADGVEVETRNGKAIEFREPCAIVYNNPRERVLFYPERDANPIFHFMESLWMLAGRNDLEWIQRYNARMGEYSDDGKLLQGAYGYRWRNYFHRDQLDVITHRLMTHTNDRRAVLAMWDAEGDLRMANSCKDHPCNTHIYFSVRDNVLDMTVCNRSNDMIWGALGANAVHMSILQEYIASRIGASVGIYTQFSNNLHAYTEVLKKLEGMNPDYESYNVRMIRPDALVNNIESFDEELGWFIEDAERPRPYKNSCFSDLAQPMHRVWQAWKAKELALAFDHCADIKPDDWHLATWEWLERRRDKWQEKATNNT